MRKNLKQTFCLVWTTCLAAALALPACKEQEMMQEQPIVEEAAEPTALDNAIPLNRARTPEAAIAEAISAMDALEAASPTGAKSHRRVADITAVRNPEFGAKGNALPDTMMYIVNFADGMGYALVSADHRTSTIYALATEGSIDLSDDANEPPALAVFHANAGAFYRQEIEHFHLPLPSDGIKDDDNTPAPKPKPVITMQYGPWETTQTIEPMVPVCWGQYSPYNNNADMIDGNRAVAGCLATAIAQLMAYYMHPQTYNWDEILKICNTKKWWEYPTNISNIEVARLFRNIADNVNMQYGIKASGAYLSDAPLNFKKHNYAQTGICQDYNFDKVKLSMLDGVPVIIGGFAHMSTRTYKKWFWGKKITEINYDKGHA